MPNIPNSEQAEDLSYYRCKYRVFVRDIEDLISLRHWDEIEDAFFAYGRFLERHPETLSVV